MPVLLRTVLVALFLCSCGTDSDLSKPSDPTDTGFDASSDVPDVGEIDGGTLAPKVVFTPNMLSFGPVPVGATQSQSVQISNAGGAPLEVFDVVLIEQGGSPVELATGTEWFEQTTVEPDGSAMLTVNYSPIDESGTSGQIEFRTNDPEWEDQIITVPIEVRSVSGPAVFSTDVIYFSRVAPVTPDTEDTVWQLSEVTNVGDENLIVQDIVVAGANSEFSVTFPTSDQPDPGSDSASFETSTLAPGESLDYRVYFNPSTRMPASDSLVISSNDPEQPEFEVALRGNAQSACLQLTEESGVEFGLATIGRTATRTLLAENCSRVTALEVSGATVCTTQSDGTCDSSDSTFALSSSVPATTIEPGESLPIEIAFSPTDEQTAAGEFTLTSNDPAKSNLTVELSGTGTNNSCPTAVAEGRAAFSGTWGPTVNAEPLTTVELRGINSSDVDGTVQSYEWTIIQRPSNSLAQFSPDHNSPTPSVFVDVAGDYVFELSVFDDAGLRSCSPARVELTAVPGTGLYIELTWDTPADIDPTDEFGADLDLHFLHPDGEWNTAPWGIYWNNPTADWGPSGPDGDPVLSSDVSDGSAPETLTLEQPESDTTYSVGVHYQAPNGFGASYATVRLFVDGVDTFVLRDRLLQGDGAFLHAFDVTWPGGAPTLVDTVHQDIP